MTAYNGSWPRVSGRTDSEFAKPLTTLVPPPPWARQPVCSDETAHGTGEEALRRQRKKSDGETHSRASSACASPPSALREFSGQSGRREHTPPPPSYAVLPIASPPTPPGPSRLPSPPGFPTPSE